MFASWFGEKEAPEGTPGGDLYDLDWVTRGVDGRRGLGRKVNCGRKVIAILTCLCPPRRQNGGVPLKPPQGETEWLSDCYFFLQQKLEKVPLGELSSDFYSGSLSAMELVFAAASRRWLG